MGNSESNASELYTKGLYPVYKNMYEFLLKKYENIVKLENTAKLKNTRKETNLEQPITTRLNAIKAFIDAMENTDNIRTLREARIDTLNIVCNDLLRYIKKQTNSKKQDGIKGGDGTDSAAVAVAKVINNLPVPNLENKLSVENLPARPLTQEEIITIRDAFKSYATEALVSIEAIKINNRIRKQKENESIRPNMLWLLVKKLHKILNNPSSSKEDIKTQVHCIIQWYLLHNETKGINLDKYKEMKKILQTHDNAALIPFVKDVNSFLRFI